MNKQACTLKFYTHIKLEVFRCAFLQDVDSFDAYQNRCNKNITFEEAGKDLLSEKVPSENFVTVEQLGGLCSFLCSDNAEQLTGQDIAVDGGWTSVQRVNILCFVKNTRI